MKIDTKNLWNDGSNCRYISYLFEQNEATHFKGKRPAIVVCPGGGYLTTEYKEGEPVALHFSSMGYQAFVLHYHTKASGGNVGYPQPLYDIAKLMLEIRTHAEEWNIDPDKIGIIGFSAGGNLCSLLSTRWNSKLLKDKFGVANEMFKPNFAILCYALTTKYCQPPEIKGKVPLPEKFKPYAYLVDKLYQEMYRAFFGTAEPTEEQLNEINVIDDVDEHVPPTFIWTTANDFLVYAENSLEYAKALSHCNIPFELHVFENGLHGLSKGTKDTAANEDEINESVAQWVPLADKWLKNLNDF